MLKQWRFTIQTSWLHYEAKCNIRKLNLQVHEEILKSKNLSSAVRNNGGGFTITVCFKNYNPNGGGIPNNEVGNAIVESFGSFDNFKDTFSKVVLTQFGSGWAWLCVNDGK